MDFLTAYGGVLHVPCAENPEHTGVIKERDILLLRNAAEGYSCPRLLDIKMGEVTAVDGWRGKACHSLPPLVIPFQRAHR